GGHPDPDGAGTPRPEPLQDGQQPPAGQRRQQGDDHYGPGADFERLLTVGDPQRVPQQRVGDQPHEDGSQDGQGRDAETPSPRVHSAPPETAPCRKTSTSS